MLDPSHVRCWPSVIVTYAWHSLGSSRIPVSLPRAGSHSRSKWYMPRNQELKLPLNQSCYLPTVLGCMQVLVHARWIGVVAKEGATHLSTNVASTNSASVPVAARNTPPPYCPASFLSKVQLKSWKSPSKYCFTYTAPPLPVASFPQNKQCLKASMTELGVLARELGRASRGEPP